MVSLFSYVIRVTIIFETETITKERTKRHYAKEKIDFSATSSNANDELLHGSIAAFNDFEYNARIMAIFFRIFRDYYYYFFFINARE